ncbi:MAG: type IV pilus assembly protein PilM [Patescibacteria group bacterium]|nr:type IV pilus assembly protein PilM [Patescibacteria group bacterium]MDD5554220.1 type IV pilus assembly protein PilM [Patescibacteria group bacterium]
MLFSKNSIYPLGLDISDLSLKLVQLNKAGSKIKIQALGKVSVPEGLIVEGEIKNEEEVANIIKKLISKPKYGKVSSDMVVACLPETKTFIKLIEVEKTPNNLADIIETEIEKHVPLLPEDIYYDWQVIGERENVQLVLIGAAPKKIVNQYTNLLDKAKLSVEALEIEPISLCRSLLPEESPGFKGEFNKNYAVIDIGATRTSMVVYANNTILFTVSVPVSGEEITADIASSLEIEKDQAEKAKIICGLDEAKAGGIINKVLAGMISDLNEKVNEILEFYGSHFPQYGPISEIRLCGGGANIKDIDKIISKFSSIKVVRGDALVNLGEAKDKFLGLLSETYSLDVGLPDGKKKKEGGNLSITQDSSLTFATAIGLALRGIFIDKI